jgi:hypothetical protein
VEAESPSSDHLDSGRRAASNEDWLITSPAAGTMARSAVAAASIATADPLVAVSELLCGAKTEDQIADLVLDAMRQDVPRRVLFKVQGSSAYVWRSAGAAIDSDATSIVRFPILSESIFGLLHGDDYYAGPLPSDPVHLGFYRKLGIDAPARILVLPVHLDDQLIAMFYGDGGGDGTVGGSVEHHRRLLVKAALAVNVVRTKQKIRAV